MAKNVTLLGANYSDVPAVDLPQTGGGTATFTDVSDTTATTEDVLAGTYFYNAAGQKVEGELSGGGGRVVVRDTPDSHGGTIRTITSDEELYIDSLEVTENGTYTAPTGTAYDTVDVDVDSFDGPIFTATYEPGSYFSNLISITCNKTFSECSNVYFASNYSAILLETDGTISDTAGFNVYDHAGDSIVYETGRSSGITRITYNDTGTMVLDWIDLLQSKSVTPSESAQTITADSGYDGLSQVSVGAISSTYVGTGITRRSSSDLTASGATVTVPSGYYQSQATKAVSSGSATGPTSLSGTSATVSTGTNTLTLTKTGVTTTPTVTAGYVSSATASTASVSLTANVTTKAAATITPTTTNQTIAANQYLTGAQTIAGDANLVSENIAEGVSIFGITGTHSGSMTYPVITGSDVKFYDYDGTLLYSYSAADIQTMSELPANPSHPGLTAQGWNWTLSEIRTQLSTVGGKVIVGQMYVTDDGKTRLYVSVDDAVNEPEVTIGFRCSVDGGVTIDWGDNSTELSETTSYNTYTHEYTASGDYVITLKVTSGQMDLSSNDYTQGIMGINTDDSINLYRLKKVEVGSSLGNNISIKYAFANCYNLEQVSFPTTCVINAGAFSYCNTLDFVVCPKNESYSELYSAFGNCVSLKSISIPVQITQIAQASFDGCSSLSEITIPYNVTRIRSPYNFRRCYSLQKVYMPSGVTDVGSYLFYECKNLSAINWPTAIIYASYLFYGCQLLRSIPAPVDGVNTIAEYMCFRCHELEYSIPSNITSVGASAFRECEKIAWTTLPSGLTSIGSYAFYGCINLALTSLPSGLTTIPSYAFYGCSKITLTTLPSGLTNIAQYAFMGCAAITSITCEGAITTFSTYVFHRCTSLVEAKFPNLNISSLSTTFGTSTAADACQNLKVVDIGSTKTIAANAFANCYSLDTLILRRSGAICSLGAVSAFNNTPMNGYNSLTGTVYVPSSLISSYQTASNWSTLYNNGTISFVAIEGSDYELE